MAKIAKTSPPQGGAARPRPVFVVVYERFQLLDGTGPAQVFATANEEMQAEGKALPYDVRLVSVAGGVVASSSGIALLTEKLPPASRAARGTVIAAGGGGVSDAMSDKRLIAWLRKARPLAARSCSVCTGAFLLAQAGLLEGRAAVTHWRHAEKFARQFPNTDTKADAIFVRSGSVYTSAGVTAGIDLCLSLVEEDLGKQVALRVAKRLVVHLKRPGGQLQFSSELLAQHSESPAFAPLLDAIRADVAHRYTIQEMAGIVKMSARNFHRRFSENVGVTPAKFLARTRLEQACRLIEGGTRSAKAIARGCGFASEANMRNAFVSYLGVTPREYQARFR